MSHHAGSRALGWVTPGLARADTMSMEELFERSPDAHVVIDPYGDRVLAGNAAFRALIGCSREGLASLSLRRLAGDQVAQLIVFSEAVLEKGEGWTDTLSLRGVDGSPREIECHAVRIDGGHGSTLLAVVRDRKRQRDWRLASEADGFMRRGLSEWRRVEQLFQEIEQQNRLILQAAGEGIYGVDADGLTTFVNPAAAAHARLRDRRADRATDARPAASHARRRQSLPGDRVPDLRRVPRRCGPPGDRRGLLAQGRHGLPGRIHQHADPPERAPGRRGGGLPRRQRAARDRAPPAPGTRGAGTPAAAAGTGERLPAGRDPRGAQLPGDRRPQRRAARDHPPHRDGRADRCHRARHRRVRHRQGAGRARDPPEQHAQLAAADPGQLRGDSARAVRERVLRARQGARSPGPCATAPGASSWPTAAPCSWTRWARSRSSCRASCCACCRRAVRARRRATARGRRRAIIAATNRDLRSARWPRAASARISTSA
jgi:PAS domain-containing protein